MTWGCLLTIVGPPRQWLCFCNSRSFSFLKIFNFALEYSRLTNNAVIVSSEQQKESAIHIHVSIVPQNLFPSRLPHIIEQGFMCYIVGPCWLSILNTAVCTCPSQTPRLSLFLPFFPVTSISSFSKSMNLQDHF